MDYNEVVARLTIAVVSILASHGTSATYGDVFSWLYSKGVHHSDDAVMLANEYLGLY